VPQDIGAQRFGLDGFGVHARFRLELDVSADLMPCFSKADKQKPGVF
jgi:hypothetical protein